MKTTLRRCFQRNFNGIVVVLISALIYTNVPCLGVALLILSGSLLCTNVCYELLYGEHFTNSTLVAFLMQCSIGRAICRVTSAYMSFFPPELLELPLSVQFVVLVGLLIALFIPGLYFLYLAVITVAVVRYYDE